MRAGGTRRGRAGGLGRRCSCRPAGPGPALRVAALPWVQVTRFPSMRQAAVVGAGRCCHESHGLGVQCRTGYLQLANSPPLPPCAAPPSARPAGAITLPADAGSSSATCVAPHGALAGMRRAGLRGQGTCLCCSTWLEWRENAEPLCTACTCINLQCAPGLPAQMLHVCRAAAGGAHAAPGGAGPRGAPGR